MPLGLITDDYYMAGALPATIRNINFMNFMEECYKELEIYVPFDGDNLFVTGGYFVNKFIGHPIRDIDVYVNLPSLEPILEEYENIGWLTASTRTSQKGTRCVLVNEYENFTIDLIGFHEPKNRAYKYNFDFNICQISLEEGSVHIISRGVIDYLYDRQLKFTGNCYIKTISRLAKYLQKGFKIDEAEVTAITNCYVNQTLMNKSSIGYL